MLKRGGKGFFVVFILISLFVVLSFTGIHTWYGDIEKVWVKGVQDIRWGIDIRGGVDVTFSPPEDYAATKEEMVKAEALLKERLVALSITDYEVYTDFDKSRLIVRFPWKEGESDFSAENAIKELGTSYLLTFREGVEYDNTTGAPAGVTAENIILQGNDIESAQATYVGSETGGQAPVVLLTMSREGTLKFAQATERLIGGVISIWMDDMLISSPSVSSVITEGQCMIEKIPTIEQAMDMADKINAGALPFRLITENYSTISPTLGIGARDAMAAAGIIAFAIIALLMIFMYKLPGFVAVIGLAGQIGLIIASLSGFFPSMPSYTLTLPGIAGIILSIGFGVDANVITAERIKEELNAGKTIDGAVKAGFNKAFSAIIDGNITVIIVAIVLMGAFGTPGSFFATLLKPVFFMFGPATAGTIYSFGYTLLVGVLFNFVMGIAASRAMIKSLSKIPALRKLWLYGGGKEEKAYSVRYNHNLKKYMIISAAILAVVIVGASFGVNLDIQFHGGTIITYSYEGSIVSKDISDTVADTLEGASVSVQQSQNMLAGTDTFIVNLSHDKGVSAEDIAKINTALADKYSENKIESVEVSNVDPTIGSEFLFKCITAIVFASVLMLIYVAVRFKKIGGLSAGATAVFALIHDVVVVFGVFVIFKMPINDNFIAVVLTILGYSLNDTIVIYDRIRENKSLLGSTKTIREIVDLSINQSFKRSLMTSLTTVISMIVVTVVSYIYKVDTILSFSFPLIIGLISGAYSSICLAGPLWVRLKEKNAPLK